MSQKKYCDFGRSTVSNLIEPYSAMNNSKLFLSAICLLRFNTCRAIDQLRPSVAVVVAEAAVAATSAEWAECHAAASLVAEWARAARVGAVANWNRAGAWNGRNMSGRNWNGHNNWHGNNWHNGHNHNRQ